MEKLNIQEIMKQYTNINIDYDFMHSTKNDITFIMRNVNVNNGEYEKCKSCSPYNDYGKTCNESQKTCGLKRYEEVCGSHYGVPCKDSSKFIDKLVSEFEF